MHVSDGIYTAGLAFILGALHALEPGHGKTAVFAYMISGKRPPRHALVMGLASGLSHTVSIMIFAFLAHAASHLLTSGHDDKAMLTPIFTWVSGILMTGIGIRLLMQALRPPPRRFAVVDSCSCGKAHGPKKGHAGSPEEPSSFKLSALLGMSGGLMPCPSAIASYMTAIAGGSTLDALLAILIYAAGIAVSITALGWLLHLAGERVGRLVHRPSYARFAAHAQAVAILGIGLFYTGRSAVSLFL